MYAAVSQVGRDQGLRQKDHSRVLHSNVPDTLSSSHVGTCKLSLCRCVCVCTRSASTLAGSCLVCVSAVLLGFPLDRCLVGGHHLNPCSPDVDSITRLVSFGLALYTTCVWCALYCIVHTHTHTHTPRYATPSPSRGCPAALGAPFREPCSVSVWP